jgi:hypothetical protein
MGAHRRGVEAVDSGRELEAGLALIGFDLESLIVAEQSASETQPDRLHEELPLDGDRPKAEPPVRSVDGNRSNSATRARAETERIEQLIDEHGLMPRLAEMVATRRLTMQSARMLQRRAETAMREERRGSGDSPIRAYLLFILFVALVLWVGFRGGGENHRESEVPEPPSPAIVQGPPDLPAMLRAAPAPAPTPSELVGTADVVRGRDGAVARVTGSNPQVVLREFCRASGACHPAARLELATAVPAQPGLRLGLFRDAGNPDRRSAVFIRKDRRTRRWRVGDGEQVRLYPTANLRIGDARVFVAH